MLTKSQENLSVEFDSAFKNINKKESSIQTDYCIVNVLNGGNKFGFIHAENKRIYVDKYSPEKLNLWRKSVCETIAAPHSKTIDSNNYMVLSRNVQFGETQFECVVCLGRKEKDGSRTFITGYFKDE